MSRCSPEIEPGRDLELRVGELASGGRGLARARDGRVVLVAGGLPGELVRARVLKVRARYLEARTLEVWEPSPQRVEPACPLYGRCGGCNLMHLAYSAQVEAKAAWLAQALSRLEGVPAVRTHPSPRSLGYRRRLRLQVQEGRAGFFAPASHRLVPVERCPVAAGGINRLLAGLAGGLPAGVVGLEILAGEQGPVLVTLELDRRVSASRRRRLEDVLLAAGAGGVRLRAGRWLGGFSGEGVTYHQRHGLELRALPGLFCQANFAANRILLELVLGAAGPGRGGRLLDLYAGSGNFSLPLARAGWRVLALEGVAQAVALGREQARAAGLEGGLRFQRREVGRALGELVQRGEGFGLVVLDPPRAGAKGLMPQLAALGARRLVYISCHAAALARDARVLVQAGYRPRRLDLVDMFPHTGHLEAVLVMDRGS